MNEIKSGGSGEPKQGERRFWPCADKLEHRAESVSRYQVADIDQLRSPWVRRTFTRPRSGLWRILDIEDPDTRLLDPAELVLQSFRTLDRDRVRKPLDYPAGNRVVSDFQGHHVEPPPEQHGGDRSVCIYRHDLG